MVLVVVGVGTVSVGLIAYLEYRKVPRVDIHDPEAVAPEPAVAEAADDPADGPQNVAPEPVTERQTILVVGSDSREGLSDEQLQALGTEDAGSDLTDTIILVQLDPQRDVAAMLSFPRDLLVDRCDGTRGRINSVFYVGELIDEGQGANCLVQTIEELTGIYINHYVRVNFAGFIQVVDAVGGVTFYVDRPLRDDFAGLNIPEGCVTFDGARALGFVRARHLDSGGDFGRIARQQRFARELLQQATSVGTLANPARLIPLINSLSDTLEVDSGFAASDMIDLVRSMQNLSADGVDVRTVPAVNRTIGGAAYVVAIDDEAEALYRAFRTGETLPDHVGTDAAPEELTPQNVQPVTILNGSDVDGLAEQAAAALEAAGFTIAETGTAENFGFETTVVFYPLELADQAALIAEALGDVQLQVGPAEDGLRVVVGSAYETASLGYAVQAAGLGPTEVPEVIGEPTDVPPPPDPEPTDDATAEEEAPATDEAEVTEEPVATEDDEEEAPPDEETFEPDEDEEEQSEDEGAGSGSGSVDEEEAEDSDEGDAPTFEEEQEALSGAGTSVTGGDDLSEHEFLGAELSEVAC